MIASVVLTLCLGAKCEVIAFTAEDVPLAYCSSAMWQIDAQRWFGAAALIDQGYTVDRAECVVS